MNRKAHILVLCYSHLPKDARVLRQVEALAPSYTVSTAAYEASGMETGGFVRLGLDTTDLGLSTPVRKLVSLRARSTRIVHRWTKDHEGLYWTPARKHALKQLRHLASDLIIANDLNTLPMALALAREHGAKVLFDAHEYFPGQHEDDPNWVANERDACIHLCTTLMPRADRCLTVSPTIAEAYSKLTGVRPLVITNAPAFADLAPTISEGPIRLVHHGGASPKRRTEDLIVMMDGLGHGYQLHLFLVEKGAEAYLARMRAMAAERTNIFFHPPVSPADLPRTINPYDIGVHSLPPVNTNHEFALPNKLFDFIQARLAIVVSPNAAMGDLVREKGVGKVALAHGPEALADAVRGMDRNDIRQFKQRSHERAVELSASGNMELLRSVVRDLLDKSDIPVRQ